MNEVPGQPRLTRPPVSMTELRRMRDQLRQLNATSLTDGSTSGGEISSGETGQAFSLPNDLQSFWAEVITNVGKGVYIVNEVAEIGNATLSEGPEVTSWDDLLQGVYVGEISSDPSVPSAMGQVWDVLTGGATGGTFTLTVESTPTGALVYNISAADMQTALETIVGVGSVTVSLTGSDYTITFGGVLVGEAVTLTADFSALTGGTGGTLTDTTPGVSGTLVRCFRSMNEALPWTFEKPASAGGAITNPVTYTSTVTYDSMADIINQGAPTTYTADTTNTVNTGVTVVNNGPGTVSNGSSLVTVNNGPTTYSSTASIVNQGAPTTYTSSASITVNNGQTLTVNGPGTINYNGNLIVVYNGPIQIVPQSVSLTGTANQTATSPILVITTTGSTSLNSLKPQNPANAQSLTIVLSTASTNNLTLKQKSSGLPAGFYPLINPDGADDMLLIGQKMSASYDPGSAGWYTLPPKNPGYTTVNDANYIAAVADKLIGYTALTAARIVTLPLAANKQPGSTIQIQDIGGNASGTNTISVNPAGSDTVNGVTSPLVGIKIPYGGINLETDGVSKWVIPQTPSGTTVVESTDGSLTVTNPVAGTYNAVLNVGHTNNWTTRQNFEDSSGNFAGVFSNTNGDGVVLAGPLTAGPGSAGFSDVTGNEIELCNNTHAIQVFVGGVYPIGTPNGDGSVYYDISGVMTEDLAGNFLYDPDGTHGLLALPNTLYIGGQNGNTARGTLALWDNVSSVWRPIAVQSNNYNFNTSSISTSGGITCGAVTCNGVSSSTTVSASNGGMISAISAASSAVGAAMTLRTNVTSGTPSAGFGVSLVYEARDSTTANTIMSTDTVTYTTTTHASRATQRVISMTDFAATRPIITMAATGSSAAISFLAVTTAIVAQTGDIGAWAIAAGYMTGTVTISASRITGQVAVANGGTGLASATAYAPLCGGTTTTAAFQAASTGMGTAGWVLTSNGSSALPSFQAVTPTLVKTTASFTPSYTGIGATITVSFPTAGFSPGQTLSIYDSASGNQIYCFLGAIISSSSATLIVLAVGATVGGGGFTFPIGSNVTPSGVPLLAGTGTLSGGTATISTTAVASNSLILLTATSASATSGFLSVGTKTASTSFVVNSSNALDANTFNWLIVSPITA